MREYRTRNRLALQEAPLETSLPAKETKSKAKATAETEAGPSIKYYVDGKDIPIWEKQLLTIDEAAKYFSMGTPKIRALTSDEDCEFVIWNGTRRLIKRERFAEFLNSQFSV